MSHFGQQQGGTGLFGQPTQPQQSTGAIGGTGFFGQASQQQTGATGGGLFSNTGATGGPFGGGTTTTNTLGGPFGQQQASAAGAPGTGFGGSSVFGGVQHPQQQQQQPQQQAGGLYGTASGASGAGLFGMQQPQQQQMGGGPFGSSTTGTGLFGTQQPPTQQTGGGLLGSTSGTTGGGLFGTQQQIGGGGLYGSTTQPQQQQGSGLFGNTQQQQQVTGGLFGGAQQSQIGGLLLGQSTTIGQSMPGNRVANEIRKVVSKWDRSSPDCEFKTYFYNYVGPDTASRYIKPPDEDEKAYDKAWTERPNSGAVPVLAIGFGDLERRVKQQQAQVYAYRNVLHSIQEKLGTIQQKHDLTTSTKLEDCRRRHIALARRALALAAQVQVLKNRGYALQPEEEQLKKRLENLAKQVYDPSILGRVNEIWARMTVVRERARMMESEMNEKGGVEWDEKHLKAIGELFITNAKGLEYLANQVKQIEKELAELEEEMKSGAAGR